MTYRDATKRTVYNIRTMFIMPVAASEVLVI